MDVGEVPVTITFEEVDYTGKSSGDVGYVAPKPLFPYEYGKLTGNTVAVDPTPANNAWHWAVVTSGGQYAWDGESVSGITIGNYQTYKVYKVIATVDADDVSADQEAGYVSSHSTLTFAADGTQSGIWASASAPGNLTSYGTGLTLNLQITSISASADTVVYPGYVMLYAHGAVVTGTRADIGFTVSGGAWSPTV